MMILGGLFLETPEPAAVGTALTMRLPLPGLDEPINLVGEVVHSRPEDLGRGTSGVGVKFVRMDENTRIFMRHYLETYVESGSPPPRREG